MTFKRLAYDTGNALHNNISDRMLDTMPYNFAVTFSFMLKKSVLFQTIMIDTSIEFLSIIRY